MKIIYKINTADYKLITAEINNNSDFLFNKIKNKLSNAEIKYFYSVKNEKRKCEFLGVRILFSEMQGEYSEIKYDKYGKPFVKNNYDISISHSKNVVAIIKSKKTNSGIDLEKISERINKISYKFVNDKERNNIENSEKLKYLYLIWCSKEVLYKVYSKGFIDFKENFNIKITNIKNEGVINSEILKEEFNQKYILNYKFLNINNKNDFLLVWYSGN